MSDLERLVEAFAKSNRAEGKSPRTVEYYEYAGRYLCDFLDPALNADDITPEHIEEFLADRREQVSPANAQAMYNALRPWFAWMADRGHIDRNPMERIKRPRVEQKVMPIPTADDVEAVIAACSGEGFYDKRDKAMISLLADAGLRASELVALNVTDLDLVAGHVLVKHAKGGKWRTAAFGQRTLKALRQYLKVRPKDAATERLFVSLARRHPAPILANGLHQVMIRRAVTAGVRWEALNHGLRRFAIDQQLRAGANPLDVAALVGHSSLRMVARYGQANANARALDAYLSPLDRKDR